MACLTSLPNVQAQANLSSYHLFWADKYQLVQYFVFNKFPDFSWDKSSTNIPFLVSKRGSPTFSDLGNFLNINLKTHARTNLDFFISLPGKKELRTIIHLLHWEKKSTLEAICSIVTDLEGKFSLQIVHLFSFQPLPHPFSRVSN